MQRFRIILGASLAAALVVLGSVGPREADARSQNPTPLALDGIEEPRTPLRPLGPTLPEAAPAPTAAERFAARLDALAGELLRSPRPPGADASAFDHEGLSVGLTSLLGAYIDDANVSVHVRDLRSETVLFDYYGDTPLIPASNQKLVTSAAALHLLGSDYSFTTTVAQDGESLYVRGEGDPSLDMDDLAAIANQIVEHTDLHGIERLVVDDSAFSPQRFGPGYSSDGPGFAYEAPSGALSLEFNSIEVTAFPIRGSRFLGATLSAPSGHIVVDNRGRVGSRDKLSVVTRMEGDKTVVEVRGTLRRKTHSMMVRRRVYDGGLFAGGALAELLAQRTSSEPLPVERGVMPRDADVIVINDSEPLFELLDAGLAYSNNFISEQVLRTMAWRTTGDPGDWDAGQAILHDYWAALVGDDAGFVAANGSGLTRDGRATSSGLVDLLALASRGRGDARTLIDALPVSGDPGTMRARLRRSGQRVRAKTGTLQGVSALTGVITAEDGTPQVAFSILINTQSAVALNAARRQKIADGIVTEVLYALDDFEAQRAVAPG